MELAIIGARLAQFAGAMVLFGSPMFYLYGMPLTGVGAAISTDWPRRTFLAAAIFVGVGAILALMVQTAALTDDPLAAFRPSDIWSVITGTGYGLAVAIRIGLVGAALAGWSILSRRWPRDLWVTQAAIGAAVVATFAWTGHGATSEGAEGPIHLVADILHLLAAAAWLGALVPFAVIILRSCDDVSAEEALALHRGLERFSGVGTTVVAILVATGVVNSWFLIGPSRIWDLFRTDYGLLLVAKLVLFGLMLCAAAANRFLHTPRLGATLLAQADTNAAMRGLRTSVIVETALALLVLGSVSVLGTLAPISAR